MEERRSIISKRGRNTEKEKCKECVRVCKQGGMGCQGRVWGETKDVEYDSGGDMKPNNELQKCQPYQEPEEKKVPSKSE